MQGGLVRNDTPVKRSLIDIFGLCISCVPFEKRHLKPIITIILICVISTVSAQDLKLPSKPYVLVIGKDTFVSQTIIEQSPDLSGMLASGLKTPGLKMTLDLTPTDTVEHKSVYLNGDSLRTWTYLFKDEKYRISFPQRIDTVNVYDIFTDRVHVEIDTINHVNINRLVKTITGKELKKLLDTEIEVYQDDNKLKVDRISVMVVWPDGKVYGTNYEQVKIGDNKSVKKLLKDFPKNAHIALDSVWFYDTTGDRKLIDGAIGWKIK
jgi:hypothetical protein